MAMLAGCSVTEEPIGLLEIRVKIQTFTFWRTAVPAGHGGRELKMKVPQVEEESPSKKASK